MVKILHVFGRMNRGGAEMRTLDVMRNIDRTTYQLEFCALTGLPGVLDEEIASLGGKTHYCKLDARFPLKFRQLLRSLKPDVVHSHVHYMSGLMVWLAHMEHVPIRVAHFRSSSDGHTDSIRRRIQSTAMRRLIDKHATAIVAVNRGSMETAWTNHIKADSRCKVIYNGLDTSPFHERPDSTIIRSSFGIPPACPLIVHVGRFSPEKNHNKVVSVFAGIREQLRDAHLILVGAGLAAVENQVRSQCDAMGITESVTFAGVRTDVPRILQSSDCLVFPSTREGLPGVVLEARAANIPVVASSIPGTNEIAAVVSGISVLDPEADDKLWARTTLATLETKRSSDIVSGLQEIEQSPFSLQQSIEAFSALWGVAE